MHKKTHTCGGMFQDFCDPEHMCYMTPVLSEIKHVHKDTNKGEFDVDSDNAKYEKPLYILFDFECTQDDIVQCEEGSVLDEKPRNAKILRSPFVERWNMFQSYTLLIGYAADASTKILIQVLGATNAEKTKTYFPMNRPLLISVNGYFLRNTLVPL